MLGFNTVLSKRGEHPLSSTSYKSHNAIVLSGVIYFFKVEKDVLHLKVLLLQSFQNAQGNPLCVLFFGSHLRLL